VPTISIQDKNIYQNLSGINTSSNTDSLLSTTANNNKNTSVNYSIANNLFLRHKFSKKGRSYSVNLGSTVSANDGNTTLYSSNQYSDDIQSAKLVNQQGLNNTNSYTYKLNLMYTEPISKTGVMQFNYSPSYAKNEANKRINNFNPNTSEYDSTALFVSNQLDNYTLTQKGGVGYRYNKKIINLMVGADYQNVKLSSTQIFPSSNEIVKSFTNILPSAMLKMKFSDSSNILIRYRASTSTPGVNQLQNVINNTNTLLLSTGNQNLKQEYTNTLNINYGITSAKKATNSMIFLNVSQTSNNISNSSFIATKDTVIENGAVVKKGHKLVGLST
jgi:hypothetical protein